MLYVTLYRPNGSTVEEWQAAVQGVADALEKHAGPVLHADPVTLRGRYGAHELGVLLVGAAWERPNLDGVQAALDEAWTEHRVVYYAELGHRTVRKGRVGRLA